MQIIHEPFIKGYGCDWLTLTNHFEASYHEGEGIAPHIWAESFAVMIIYELGLPNTAIIPTSPLDFYEHCYRLQETGIILNIAQDIRGQGVRVIISGEALKWINSHEAFVKNAIEAGWKITRIDWRIDVVNCGEKVADYQDTYRKYKAVTKGALQEKFYDSNSATQELGARDSNIWSKIYEKGKKNGTKEDWLRLEMEFKNGYATQVATAFSQGHHKEICGILVERYSWLANTNIYKQLQSFCEGSVLLRLESPRKQTDTARWFEGVVRSAFVKWLRLHPTEALGWLVNLQNTVDAVQKGGRETEITNEKED